MCSVMAVPHSRVQPVTEILHGVPMSDPYRWIEDQNSPETRAWIEEQTRYARTHLDGIYGRERIRERVRTLLDVKTYDTFLKQGSRYFFRKRLPGEEQPSIYFREGPEGQDQLLVDPAARGTGTFTAVRPLRVSADGNLLMYEVKQGGERMGSFEILDVRNCIRLRDTLPHGYLRGFAFAPDAKSFYYTHEPAETKRSFHRAAYQHTIGTPFEADREIFVGGDEPNLRLAFVSGRHQIGLLVRRFLERTRTDFYLFGMGSSGAPVPILKNAEYSFAPRFQGGRILAATNHGAPNFRIVDVQPRRNLEPLFFPVVPETGAVIRQWAVTANYIVVCYTHTTRTAIEIFDLFGKRLGQLPCDDNETVRIAVASEDDELLVERESLDEPIQIERYALDSGQHTSWAQRAVPFPGRSFARVQRSFRSKDGTEIPILLWGTLPSGGPRPAIMTAYGGYGLAVTPQFSVLVTNLVERGCFFALPSIRGGSEFGAAWHDAGKRQNRQVAFDDFLSAAQWLVDIGQTSPERLAIFGGSNSGLLVAVAMTQRPDLFGAVLCLAPLTDMVRFHLFDGAYVWKEEYGTAEDPEDFAVLAGYSPYHAIRNDTIYPATLIVSGDADQNCNSLHARKITARLQAANRSGGPILLDYNTVRGHSPVLPLTMRIEALTDRVAFLSERLGLPA